MQVRQIIAAGLLVAACGKGTGDQKDPAVEPRPISNGSAPPPPAVVVDAGPPRLAPRSPERAAYSLVDNRLAAHVERGGGLVVMAGSAGFAKYTRIGNVMKGAKPAWRAGPKEGEVAVARMTGASAAIYVPLTAAQAARPTVRLRVFRGKPGPLRLRVNGGAPIDGGSPTGAGVGEPLPAGWSTVDLAVPAGQLVAGENTLELVAGAPGTALAWLHVGPEAPIAEAAASYDTAARALAIPDGGRMSWYVLVPADARLAATATGAGCRLALTATDETGAAVSGEAAIDLAAMAGKAARLELAVTGCPRALVAEAALTVPGAPPAITRGEPPKYVVFVVLDSLRVDRVHAFEPAARAETPVLDKLAASSALFVNHYVQGNESQVSHAAMWTSMYLAKHRAARWHEIIPAKFTTLDEVAKRAGKYVAGATANGYIRPARGFGTAWGQYANHIEQNLGLRGEQIVDQGLAFLAPRKTAPWFLYLGLIDTHVTWRAKQPWLERYDPGYKGRYAKDFGDEGPTGGFPKDLTDREKDHVRAIYDSNVSYQDDVLGKLIAKLEAWGVWDQTMLVVTADHGDEQWEAGRVGHEKGQDDTLLHVPLLVHYPPVFPAARITAGSEGIDILPTIADALGVAADAAWQGASLVPAAHGARAYTGLVSSSEYEEAHGGRVGPWKAQLAGTAAPRIYHLTSDRDETKDVYATAPIGTRLVLDAMWLLRAHHAEWTKAAWGDPANVSPGFAEALGE